TEENELQLDQDIKQDSTSAGLDQQQDAHQYAVLDQTASGKGNNFAHVHQSQDQDATGAATIQGQNTTVVTPAPTDTLVLGCNAAADTASNGFVTTPNACAQFTQTSVDGDNDGHLHQMANEDEKSSVTAVQNQGFAGNGLGGSFEQTVAPTGRGSSHN